MCLENGSLMELEHQAESNQKSDFKFLYLVTLGLTCGMQDLVPDQGSNLDPLHWEHRVLAIGPPGKSQQLWTLSSIPVVVIDVGQWLDLLDHSDSSSTHGPLNPWCKERV